MGLGDQIIASGLARNAWAQRGRKVAFGDGQRIIWDKHSKEVFQNNPNVCFPGNERSHKLEWIAFHKGHRGYNTQGPGHWIWNMDWRCKPGELFLSHGENSAGKRHGNGFVVIEPNVVRWKSSAANKDWGADRYQALADRLVAAGHKLVQFVPPPAPGDPPVLLANVRQIATKRFRDAVTILKNAAAYVGAEGGLHHAAAAVSVPGVVIFGGFIPPSVTGYAIHANLAGSDRFCGSFASCDHCREAMASIKVERVFDATLERLNGR
jgi:ADP-heptose:LPS heptosyltransferase